MIVGFDTETHLIKPGCIAPKLVCVSSAQRLTDGRMHKDLAPRDLGLQWLHFWLSDPSLVIVGANLPYDAGVACAEEPALLPHVFDAYRDHRMRCVQTKQKLLDVALGQRKWRRRDGVVTKASYSLADLVRWWLGEHLEKEDTWRLRYALLDGVPIDRWPEDAKAYAIGDAVQALRVHEAQERFIAETWGELPNQVEQQRAHFALHLMSMWGVRAEHAAVEHFVASCEHEIEKMRVELAGTGILKPKKDGGTSRVMKEIRRRIVESLTRLQIDVPMTDPSERFPDGQVQTDGETLELTDDPKLHALADALTFEKHLGQWGPVARAAVHRPVCARYNVLVDTGRTSCSASEGGDGTNFQNPPRKGEVRGCFVPRRGFVFCSTDADTIELRALAQCCLDMLGRSRMAEALRRQHDEGGPDLHLTLAAAILGIDPREAQERHKAGDPVVKEARQFAKIPNFGFPGGLGPATFVSYAKSNGQELDPDPRRAFARAQELRAVWFKTWPEMREYFRVVGDMIGDHGEGTVRQLMSGRIRGGTRFTAAANGFFQGRVADAMKEILFRLADECYTGRCTTCDGTGYKLVPGGPWPELECLECYGGKSPLHGSRPVLFLHDEPILEHPEDGTEHERAMRQRDVMVEVLNRWMPDVPCTSSAVLMRRWQKGAEPVFVDGRLVPSRPEKVDGRVRWVHDAKDARRAA